MKKQWSVNTRYSGEDITVSTATLQDWNRIWGFQSSEFCYTATTEAPQLLEITLASSSLLTDVITSTPFWRTSVLLIISLCCPIFGTYNVNQLQKPQISDQYMSIYVYTNNNNNLPPPPRVRIHSWGEREVRRIAGCYHWWKVITLIHAERILYCVIVRKRRKWAKVTTENRSQDYNLGRLSTVE
jgi:hypothetical protein